MFLCHCAPKSIAPYLPHPHPESAAMKHKFTSSAAYLDLIAQATGCTTDGQIARALGCTRQAVSNYRLGLAGFDAPISQTVASILGIHAGTVMLDMQIQRTRDDATRDVWEQIAQAFAPALPRSNRRRSAHA